MDKATDTFCVITSSGRAVRVFQWLMLVFSEQVDQWPIHTSKVKAFLGIKMQPKFYMQTRNKTAELRRTFSKLTSK